MSPSPKPAASGKDGLLRLPGSLHVNRRLSKWLTVRPEGVVEVRSGKVEIGQGILTALAQIAADELDVALARIVMVPANTAVSPDEAVTSGSLSVSESGTAIRHASAEARAIYLAVAAERLQAPVESLTVDDGTIRAASGASTSYWALADDALLDREPTGSVPPKPASARRLAGTPAPRLDIPDKVFGRPRFIHDLTLPRMLHGRVLRPAAPGARLVGLDEQSVRRRPGVVAVVRDGDFAGVIAETEPAAVAAVEALCKAARWSEGIGLPDETRLGDWLEAQPAETTIVFEKSPAMPAAASTTIRRRCTRPFIAHASIGPSCAIARWRDGGLEVWSHSQGITNLRTDLALTFGIEAASIVVAHVEGAGCYGHNGADDVALDAALLARAASGRPVRVEWSRADELAWSPVGAAMVVETEAGLDENGNVVSWRHELWSNGHTARPGRAKSPKLLAAGHLAKPFPPPEAVNPPLASGGGAERNATPPYDFPAQRIVSHRVRSMPIRVSALRSLGAFANVLAVETMVDEIAAMRGEDPIAFRLRQLPDPRARAVVEAAARRSGWSARIRREGIGHGLGYARYKTTGAYCAAFAEIEAGREIRAARLWIAVDVGEPINPDGVANQIEGGAIQAVSWTLKEAVRFDRSRILSDGWEGYPILRFSEVPAVVVEIIARPDDKPVGVGEAAHGPVAGAIVNAVADALGVRIRDLPLTPERVAAALA
jgi:CO/xanthine dehydrogenase Mo-binding subunit